MSRFGQRLPNLIQQPAAVPDVSSNPAANIGMGLATALGVIQTGMQAQRGEIREKMATQELASRLKADEAEVVAAKSRLAIEQEQTERLATSIASEEQQAQARKLAEIESFGLQDKLSRMSPEDGAKWLAANPAVDPKNAETYAKSLGHQLAMAGTTRMYQKIATSNTPENISITAMLAEELQTAPFDQMHPAAREAFTEDLLREGTGFLRGRFNQVAQHRTAQAAKAATGDAMRSITRSIVGELPPGDFLNRWRDGAALRPDAGTTDVEMARTMANDLATAFADYEKVWGKDPEMLRKFNSWIEETFPANSHFNREVRSNISGDQLQTFIENKARAVDDANVAASYDQLQQGIRAAASNANLPQLAAYGKQLAGMPDTAQKQETRDLLHNSIEQIDTVRLQVNAMSDAKKYGKPMPTDFSDEALDAYAKRYGQRAAIQDTGKVPPSMIADIKKDLDTGDLASAYATFRPIAELAPTRADALSATVGKGDILRITHQMLRNVDPTANGEEFARVLGVLGKGSAPFLLADAQGILDDPKSMVLAQVAKGKVITPAYKGYLWTTWGGTPEVREPGLSPAAIRAFRDAYKFHYAEIAEGVSPDQAQKLATERARESIKHQVISVGGTHVPSNIFGVGSDADPNNDGVTALNDAIGRFERMEASVNAKPIMDKAISYQGHGYIPGAKMAPDGRVTVERFLKWNPQSREFAVIDDNAPEFDTLKGMVVGNIDPREVSNRSDIMYREEYGIRDLAEFDKQVGGDMTKAIKSHAIREYMSLYGPLPDRSDPDFASKMQTLLDLMQWAATDAGWTVDQQPSTSGATSE